MSGDGETYTTHYGGVDSVRITTNETRVELTQEASQALGLSRVVVITYEEGVVDAVDLQRRMDLLLST